MDRDELRRNGGSELDDARKSKFSVDGVSTSTQISVDRKEWGFVFLWTNEVSIDLLSNSNFHIDVKVVSHATKVWRFTGFYGNPTPDQRHHGWNLLRRLAGLSRLPWLCVGDFNEIISDEEKKGGLPRVKRLMEDFRCALDSRELEDMGFQGQV
ncbi:hypothetical protein Dsin_002323 [Dipteronia sinensis]|uniref:Exo_endo_phos domain-containing protein n=1 Tax=Dipteronia sinensis TaxID=43782 RepID=A0AAE0B6X6_9ROSI|nr:hypothetical protein Dsin_002323 [Dipteronia sinensis]